MIRRILLAVVGCLSVVLAGCGSDKEAIIGCPLIDSKLLLDMPTAPVNGAPFMKTSFSSYCFDDLLGKNVENDLGNADSWVGNGSTRYDGLNAKNRKWEPAWGASIDIYGVSPKGNNMPYMKRIEYKQADDCALEMRVYKRDINQENLKPLMLIHGGGWRLRGLAFAGAEAVVSHYTERGFIVFAPFYRLIGNSDGPKACQESKGVDISADINDAFNFMKAHGELLGAKADEKPILVGQSAGAGLSGWLSLQRPSEVKKVVLYYPPIAFRSFLKLELADFYNGRFKGALETLSTYSNDPSFPTRNIDSLTTFELAYSLPYQIRENNAEHPDFFIMQGNADQEVPIEQSTALCEALEGMAPGQASTDAGMYRCGDNSTLYIIDKADHAFDLRCLTNIIPGFVRAALKPEQLARLCPATMKAEPAAMEAIRASFEFISTP
ncbi:Uncharacterised protein [BD1-7 clade bacterium]|uniref:BD-FAE-like domain-containing protein n=1 Tax=BD1-7 clade bacterium TaxID=2029982 RepID=A0A5S9QJA4_9GAMM|nr:Uncharacterised protein [BD1-7 clade bacterium]